VTVPGLPPGYSVRRPTLADAEAILAVVHAAERDALGRDDSTLAEVRELLRLPRTPPETDQWLVEAGGQAVAWGMVIDDYGGEQVDLDVYSDPASRFGRRCSTSCSSGLARGGYRERHWGLAAVRIGGHASLDAGRRVPTASARRWLIAEPVASRVRRSVDRPCSARRYG
jgi:mycothiol synthase